VQPSKLNSGREIQPKSLLSVEQEVSQHGFAREPSEPDFGGRGSAKESLFVDFWLSFQPKPPKFGFAKRAFKV